MLIDRRLVAGAFGLAVVVTACGGSSAPTASPAPAAGPVMVASPPASSNPTATESGGAVVSEAPDEPTPPAGNPPGGAPELEAMLPSQVGGVQLQKRSFGGTSFAFDAGAPFDSSALDALLKANGKTIEDVRLAVAWPVGSKLGALGTSVMALQVKGVDATKLTDVTGGSSGQMTSTVVGGKRVQEAGSTGFHVYVYMKDDIVFTILLPSPGDAAEVLAALP